MSVLLKILNFIAAILEHKSSTQEVAYKLTH